MRNQMNVIAYLAVKTEVIWRTIQNSPHVGFVVWAPQRTFTVAIESLFNGKTKKIPANQ